jgi:general secretion pathway protein G
VREVKARFRIKWLKGSRVESTPRAGSAIKKSMTALHKFLGVLTVAASMAIHGCIWDFTHSADLKIRAAQIQLNELRKALNDYKSDTGSFPDDEAGLSALLSNREGRPGWNGPYLRSAGELPFDPWGNPYHYRNMGLASEPDVLSYGSDGIPGGEGDRSDISSLAMR